MRKLYFLFLALLFIGTTQSQNVGINTATPDSTLTVAGSTHITGNTLIGGKTKTTNFQMTTGAGANKVLTSDATGNAAWVTPAASGAHTIGESYGGGIVFYVYDNGQHGLIAATVDQSSAIRWSAGTNTNTMALADGIGAGKSNTDIIIANQGNGDGNTYAARLCHEYKGGNYGDWYLPSKYELNLLYQENAVVGGMDLNIYWSSTEQSISNGWYQDFSVGFQLSDLKVASVNVRAIRAF
jgi:hypothetical protein